MQEYYDNLNITFPLGVEEPSVTYDALVASYPGPNPFPVDVVVGKDGIIRYVTHEYDPDGIEAAIVQALAE